MDINNGDDSHPSRKGLVCHYQFEDGSSQFTFMHTEDINGAMSIDSSLSFTTDNYVQLVSSCKGLLLLSSFGVLGLKYHVFNSMSRQFFTLPQPEVDRRKVVRSGLAFDGHHYQVVLVHMGDDTEVDPNGLEIEIFSSETGGWKSCQHTNVSLPLYEFEFYELKHLSVFSNGAIYWEINEYLLVYNVKNDQSELIELPNFSEVRSWQSTMSYKRCLSESKGRVHYTYNIDGVHIWELLNEDDHDHYSQCNYYDRKKFSWKLSESVNHLYLNFRHQVGDLNLCWCTWEPSAISPIAFCEESELLYLHIPTQELVGFVVSYNTATKVIKEVCSYELLDTYFNCCSFLPFINYSKINPDTASESSERVVQLPIKQKLDTFPF